MIEKISYLILQYLLKKQVILNTDENKEFYKYGIEITVSSILNILLILCIGLILHKTVESVIFLLLFILMRQFTGGYHADTYFKCNFTFCISFLTVLTAYRFTAEYLSTYMSILMTFINVSIILLLSPIENKNKPIPQNRRKYYKIMAAVLYVCFGVTGTVLTAFSNKFGAMILYTLSLVTMLIIAAIIKKRRCNDHGQ